MSDAARWRELRRHLGAALELPVGDRPAYVADLAGADPALAAELDDLLAADAAHGRQVDAAAAAGPRGLVEPGETERGVHQGQVFGPWRLGELLGRGGMGEVYLARRDDGHFTHEAAVKVLRRSADSQLARARFRRERQLLASLDHPGIARLLDGGVTADGVPWFALERVRGVPITSFADGRGLGVRERVELMVRVSEAVDSAHRRLVVHRDLKPGNIFVTDEGRVLLLDFGIAKVVEEQQEDVTGDLLPLTPRYAAPEQFAGEPVTTATDVYGLGLVLYELLTATLPQGRMTAGGLEVASRVERRVEPPSTVVAAAGLPGREDWPRLLRGDLDAVVGRALARDPGRRYPGAADLGRDLQAWLARRPVAARPDSLWYRARLLATRHRLASAALAVATVAVATGVAATVVLGLRAQRAAAEARQQRELAVARGAATRALAKDLLFEVHDAVADLPGATRVRELLLARGVTYLDRLAAEAGGDPSLQLELARGYVRLAELHGASLLEPGLPTASDAAVLLERAATLAGDAAATGDGGALLTLIEVERRRAALAVRRGQPEATVQALHRGLDLVTLATTFGPTPELAAEHGRLLILAVILTLGHQPFASAHAAADRALAVATQAAATWPDVPELVRIAGEAEGWVMSVHGYWERWPEAERLARLVHTRNVAGAAAREGGAEAVRRRAMSRQELAWCVLGLGRAAEALTLVEESLAEVEHLAAADAADQLAPTHLGRTLELRGDILDRLGRRPAALADMEEARRIHERLLAADRGNWVLRSRVAWDLRRAAELRLALGAEPARARTELERARALLEQNLSADPGAVYDRLSHARTLSALAGAVGDQEAARDLAERAERAWRELAAADLVPPSEAGRLEVIRDPEPAAQSPSVR